MNSRDRAADRVELARALGSLSEVRDLYDGWAASYDRDVYERLNFIGPDRVVDQFAGLIETDVGKIMVLDVGCGTGAVGERLIKQVEADIDGLDLSAEMLRVAAHKGAYRNLIEADLSRPLEIEPASYDAVLSAGTFVSGHVRADALVELVRVTRPSGHLVFTVMEAFWEPGGFAEVIPALVASGGVEVLDDRQIAATTDGSSTVRLLSLRRMNVSPIAP